MKLELKNIKYYASMSEETDCYEAMLYVEGKRLGRVHNDGRGGSDRHDFSWKDYERIDEWCVKNLPKWTSDFDKSENNTNLEMWCHDQVTDYLIRKDLKRHLKKLFVMETDNNFYTYKVKWSDLSDDQVAEFNKKHPTRIVLNALPFDEALELYRKHTQ